VSVPTRGLLATRARPIAAAMITDDSGDYNACLRSLPEVPSPGHYHLKSYLSPVTPRHHLFPASTC
jgi:hypothetical protein